MTDLWIGALALLILTLAFRAELHISLTSAFPSRKINMSEDPQNSMQDEDRLDEYPSPMHYFLQTRKWYQKYNLPFGDYMRWDDVRRIILDMDLQLRRQFENDFYACIGSKEPPNSILGEIAAFTMEDVHTLVVFAAGLVQDTGKKYSGDLHLLSGNAKLRLSVSPAIVPPGSFSESTVGFWQRLGHMKAQEIDLDVVLADDVSTKKSNEDAVVEGHFRLTLKYVEDSTAAVVFDGEHSPKSEVELGVEG